MTRRRRILNPLTALSLVAFGMVVTSPSANADSLDFANFQLRPNAYGTALRDRADNLPLVKATVTDIMNDLNRVDDDDPTDTGEACEPNSVVNNFEPVLSQSMCFNDGDNATTEWYPQGVTTAADMQSDQIWGDGYQPVLVSWYDHNNNADGMLKGVRISFMNRDTGRYRHVLLVYPREINGRTDYDTIRVSQDPASGDYNKPLHAGGLVWYGNYLFVADTARGFRVFDMRRIYDLGASSNGTTTGDMVGYRGSTYYGYGYRYIMPQVGSWTRTSATGTTCTAADLSPNFSYVSLDRSGTDHLVAGEYCNWDKETNGRVAAWPMAGAFVDNELRMDPNYVWNADDAHNLPSSNVQGVARFEGRWYLSVSDGPNAGKFYTTAKVVTSFSNLEIVGTQYLPVGPEDLSHWPGTAGTNPARGVFWTVSEHPGQRMVYSVIPQTG
ncbi:hypothetical protein [Saccharothrix deserti]|uniref:hypothetical protein n=1 Tax=Saccharothrix deserti TaxID=2593674 RepID=UPI001EE48BB1|nr:hypothetical protein [Saccharothrix deserti]